MNDIDLITLAAKAAGIERGEDRFECGVNLTEKDGRHRSLPKWNPLTDDGDALRLAVKLRLDIDHEDPRDQGPGVWVSRRGIRNVRAPVGVGEEFDDEIERGLSTRRAIVRAAAEIGRAMP